jgi:hypothetical protein
MQIFNRNVASQGAYKALYNGINIAFNRDTRKNDAVGEVTFRECQNM